MYCLVKEVQGAAKTEPLWKPTPLGGQGDSPGIYIDKQVQHARRRQEQKKARYISRNIELNQNSILLPPNQDWLWTRYTTQVGSTLYSIFSLAAERLEASFKRSIKVKMVLPLVTHRYLIQPLLRKEHIRKTFVRRFSCMIQLIRNSTKPVLNMLLSAIEQDARSVTGRILRCILMDSGKYNISDFLITDCQSIKYHTIEEENIWRIEVIKNILEERCVFSFEDEDLLEYLCCQ